MTEGEKSAILSLRKYPANYVIASTSEAILRDCHACLRQARNDNGTGSFTASAVKQSLGVITSIPCLSWKLSWDCAACSERSEESYTSQRQAGTSLVMTEKKERQKSYASD